MIKPKVSIIIPVYNVENYIRDCVESVVNQTLDNIEIIIVNDGCTDHSINRIDDLIKSNNLLIVNQENKGLSAACNIGLSHATGDYIAFIDSDDYIEPNFIAMLYVNAIENNLDIVVGGYKKLFSNGDFLPEKRSQELIDSEVMTGQEYLYKSVILNDYQMEVWDDLYKRSFLEENNLKFYEGIIHEDEEFTPKCILKAKRIKVIDCLGYVYRQREGSIMTCLRSDKESVLGQQKQQFLDELSQVYSDIFNYDTVIKEKVYRESRTQKLNEMFNEFRKSKVVITDRLHGMVFCAITKTPCIVTKSLDHKVTGTYEWIKDLNYIKLVDKLEVNKVSELIKKLGNLEEYTILDLERDYFNSLVTKIGL
ncbi:MAG: glycosyltransferase [Turicibacter sp.]|nr:glycosyltransferase [Turicibacter sp.]